MSDRNPQFKNYLNENINLITILGIFNGLSIYSSTLDDDSGGKYLLGFVFTLISVLILRELILDIPGDEGLALPILTFMFGLCAVWLFLIYMLFKNYTTVTNMIFALLAVIFFMYVASKVLQNYYLKKIRKKSPKLFNLLTLIIIICSIIIGTLVWFYVYEFIQSVFEFQPKRKITY